MFTWKLLSEKSDMSIRDPESKRGHIKVKRILNLERDYCSRIWIQLQYISWNKVTAFIKTSKISRKSFETTSISGFGSAEAVLNKDLER